ncbi:MAG: exopolyphosphatase, partial [Mycobacterium sp.]|nr:exopolyphosphatase [Mycobacterium sp.]
PAAPAPDAAPPPPSGPTRRVPLGTVAGARSGDKGGAATLGVYARSDDGYRWLAAFLTGDRLRELLPEAAALPVRRELLPHLRAVLFQLPGLLGEGVAAGTRFDPQAKAVGEWLRSRHVDVPEALLAPVAQDPERGAA